MLMASNETISKIHIIVNGEGQLGYVINENMTAWRMVTTTHPGHEM